MDASISRLLGAILEIRDSREISAMCIREMGNLFSAARRVWAV